MGEKSGGAEGTKEVLDNVKHAKEFDSEKTGKSIKTIGIGRVMKIKRE